MMQVEATKLQLTPVSMSAESHIGENQPEPVVKSFGEYLEESLSDVNKLQNESDLMNAKLAAGEVNDIAEVVVAAEKADIALQLTLQVRNKAVEAYQEIMRMQV